MGGRRRFGSVRELPSGRWQARFITPDGRQRAAPHTFMTKTDALRYLATAEADLLRGQWHDYDAGTLTVGEWGTRFLAAHRPHLMPKSFASYESLWRTCVQPSFGETLLANVQKIGVREWVAAMADRGLSPSRVRQALRLLSQVMNAAADDRLILVNPCHGVRPPRLPETDPHILTPADVDRLRVAIREPFGVLVDLLAYCGLRIGEAFALRRRSVDIMRGRLLVDEALVEVSGRHAFGETKSHQKRPIALPKFLADDLNAYMREHVPPEPDALLFVGKTGKPLHYNSFRRWIWDPAVQAAGLDDVTPHDLRATCATWVADGAGVLEAARRLGHSRASVTTRHYARPVADRDRDVADALGAIRGAALRAAETAGDDASVEPGA